MGRGDDADVAGVGVGELLDDDDEAAVKRAAAAATPLFGRAGMAGALPAPAPVGRVGRDGGEDVDVVVAPAPNPPPACCAQYGPLNLAREHPLIAQFFVRFGETGDMRG